MPLDGVAKRGEFCSGSFSALEGDNGVMRTVGQKDRGIHIGGLTFAVRHIDQGQLAGQSHQSRELEG